MKKRLLILFTSAAMILLLAKCKKEEPGVTLSSFDKAGMLSNIGEHLVVPAYDRFKISVDSLDYFNGLFAASPVPENLIALQQQFLIAYRRYQWISTFEFGPSDSQLIRAHFNTFPCDAAEITSKIASGNLDFSTIADLDVQGFPAIDYLIFGSDQNNDLVLESFTTDVNAGNRKNYLTALVNALKQRTDIVQAAWSSTGGNYIQTFKSSTGSDVGSSIGLLVNQLNFDFELLKNAKVGIPLGKKSLGVALPEKVEAYYSEQSLLLLKEHLTSIENIFRGRDQQGADGSGLDDYLVSVDAQHSLGALSTVIKNKFTAAHVKIDAIPEPLSEAVVNSPAIVDEAYAELQQLVVLLKVDMPSALGILITYQDNDGD